MTGAASVRGTLPGLRLDDLFAGLGEPALGSMTFLNEISHRFPDAVSFAAGRPHEGLFDAEDPERYLARFRRYLSEEVGVPAERVPQVLFQYGRTKGIVHDLVAHMLRIDEDMDVDPESILVTNGCQEAMVLVLRALRNGPEDVLLAVAPTYVGLTGAARLMDLPVEPVATGPAGVDLDDLDRRVEDLRARGRRVRALYVMPDFANPSGVRMTTAMRHTLLSAARRHDLLLLEDNPYGLFHLEEHLPTLKALDTDRRVVYFGSFAKTCMPGARVGYVVADQPVIAGDGDTRLLADELAKIKGMLSINTSSLSQAVVGGYLLSNGLSLARANVATRAVYQRQLRCLLDGLARRFPAGQVTWTSPDGGFFVVLRVPFLADDAALERSAREHGVLWTPMRHFSSHPAADHQLRLSCSATTPAQIETGLDRLACFVAAEQA